MIIIIIITTEKMSDSLTKQYAKIRLKKMPSINKSVDQAKLNY